MMKLTVYHDGQFWVGVVELLENGTLKAARHLFGAEPKDTEVIEWVNNHLLSFISGLRKEVAVKPVAEQKVNPKRLARLAAREVQLKGISSYAHLALQLELEARKKERKVRSRAEREAEKERKWEIARQKAKAKHRGK